MRYELLKSFDRGNPLLGVHINSIRDKNGQTFGQGNNPFDYLGFVVADDGKNHTYYEHDGSGWRVYQDLAPKNTSYAKEHWGKGFKLSTWAPCHDWIANDGYNNFATWVMNAK